MILQVTWPVLPVLGQLLVVDVQVVAGTYQKGPYSGRALGPSLAAVSTCVIVYLGDSRSLWPHSSPGIVTTGRPLTPMKNTPRQTEVKPLGQHGRMPQNEQSLDLC